MNEVRYARYGHTRCVAEPGPMGPGTGRRPGRATLTHELVRFAGLIARKAHKLTINSLAGPVLLPRQAVARALGRPPSCGYRVLSYR